MIAVSGASTGNLEPVRTDGFVPELIEELRSGDAMEVESTPFGRIPGRSRSRGGQIG
jgi:hypothetical protein